MNEKHTPGPWRIHVIEHLGAKPIEIATSGPTYRGDVAYLQHSENIEGITSAENMANAHLIAAAPDLLAALEELDGVLRSGFSTDEAIRSALDKSERALARARGEEVTL
jgi:hypothetical protein